MPFRTVILMVSLMLSVGTPVRGGETSRRVPIPDGVFYYQPAASVFGSEATWINPAGLGRFGAAGFQLMTEYHEGDYARSWGAVLYRDRATSAYRHVYNPDGSDYDEWLFAGGFGLGATMNLGVSYRHFRKGPAPYDDRHFWTIGLISRGRGPFVAGAVFSNLNRGKVDGERTAIEERYSAAYRPLGNRLTLAADMFLSTRNSLRDADYVYHVEYIPRPGLYLNAYIDSEKNFQVGVRANLLKYFVGTKSVFDSHGHHGRTIAFAGASNIRQPSLIAERRRRLAVAVSGRLAENPPRPVFGVKRTPFVTLITTIYRAANDPSIGELLIDLKGVSIGFGQAQELRGALASFKAAGKRVICHITSPNNIAYYVATIADTILIPPICQLRLVGLRAELTFWAGTFDKLGVKMELLRVGEFKTAQERYTRRAATEKNRAQVNRLLDDLYDQFVGAIAEGRGLTKDSVRGIIDNGPFTSAEALQFGLVDGLSYRDQVGERFLSAMPELSFHRYQNDTLLDDAWFPKPALAVVVAEGEITSDRGDADPLGRPGGVTPSSLARAFARARTDQDIYGIVFRVNSPGGSALAGEKIYHDGWRAAQQKPFVVSMANQAASGGYYVAMPAGRLFANPGTLTGSIGIYGGKADFSSLYEKIDLGKELYTRGQFAGMFTTTRPFTRAEREKYGSHLRAFYDHFVDLVAANRSLPADSIDNLGQGLVWTGQEALSSGLVDELGGVKQALDYMADRVGLDDYRIEIYPKKRPWFVLPGLSLLGSIAAVLSGDEPPSELLAAPPVPTEDESLFIRMPFDIEIE